MSLKRTMESRTHNSFSWMNQHTWARLRSAHPRDYRKEGYSVWPRLNSLHHFFSSRYTNFVDWTQAHTLIHSTNSKNRTYFSTRRDRTKGTMRVPLEKEAESARFLLLPLALLPLPRAKEAYGTALRGRRTPGPIAKSMVELDAIAAVLLPGLLPAPPPRGRSVSECRVDVYHKSSLG